MRKMFTYPFNRKNTLAVFLFVALAMSVSAQAGKTLSDVVNYLQTGKIDSAKIVIDGLMKDSANRKDAQANYVNGFVYKEIYKEKEIGNKQSPARVIALQSFETSLRIDTSKENRDNNSSNIHFLASKFFNDAATSLDTIHYQTAIADYLQYKTASRFIDPNFNSSKEDVNFDLALASVYSQKYVSNKKGNTSYLDLVRKNYFSVLAIDSNNYSANYNMGISYFNEAVDMMSSMDFNVDMVAMDQMQDKSVALFKQSLPFMEKAYQLKPDRKETIEGLSGIYFSLHDVRKSNEFKEKLEKLNKTN
ncbi:MAG: hypothetical protein ABI199_06890 [Bacteroidia bacterium]